MAMPRKLKLMNVFLNGYSYQGVAKSVTLPKLTRKLENYRGAGVVFKEEQRVIRAGTVTPESETV
ncbi:phage major tail tube protein, partial [Escherichia coli]|uniref:phage major tail tube protein n=1 Tax=Escherichia coli TaxID=562 RepID=UPI00207B6B7C